MKLLKELLLLSFLMAILMIVFFFVNTKINDRKYQKYASLKTLEEVINSGIAIQSFKIVKNKKDFIEIDYPYSTWTLHSGCPVAIFDSNGTIIDFSFDGGDDPDFQKKWQDLKRTEIDIKDYLITKRSS